VPTLTQWPLTGRAEELSLISGLVRRDAQAGVVLAGTARGRQDSAGPGSAGGSAIVTLAAGGLAKPPERRPARRLGPLGIRGAEQTKQCSDVATESFCSGN
jgi:hypothetical protein